MSLGADHRDTLHACWRQTAGHLVCELYTPQIQWQDEVTLASGLLTGPSVVSPSDGHLDFFWRAVDGRLKHMRYSDDSEAGPSSIEDIGGAVP